MFRLRFRHVFIAGLVFVSVLSGAIAASGKFNRHGKMLITGSSPDEALAYPGGRMLLVGVQRDGRSGLLRLRPDGSPDPSFGRRGFVAAGYFADALVLRGGKILLVAGSGGSASQPLLKRLRPDGSADTGFGQGGERIVDLGGPQSAVVETMARGNRGAILLGGAWVEESESRGGGARDPLVAKVRANGRLDASFGGDGIVDLSGISGIPAGLASTPTGATLVLAPGSPAGHQILRLRRNGTLDRSFADSGALRISVPAPPGTREPFFTPIGEIGVLRNGRMVVAGGVSATAGNKLDYSSSVLRYLPGGSPDRSFGDNGVVQIGGPGWTFTEAFAVRRDGATVVAGSANVFETSESDFSATLVRPGGALDRRFGRNGTARADLGGFDRPVSVLFQGRTRVILVGQSQDQSTSNPALSQRTGLLRLRLPGRVR